MGEELGEGIEAPETAVVLYFVDAVALGVAVAVVAVVAENVD